MQNILIVDHDPAVLNILSSYFVDLIKSYHKYYNVSYLGMILHKDNNYFTITLKDPYKGYTEYTPIPLFKRDPTLRSFLYEDDHLVPYSNKKVRNQKELWLQANIDAQLENPWVVHTIGCDDGSKGWTFRSEEQALSFIEELKNTDPHDIISPDCWFVSETQARGYVLNLFLNN